MKLVGEKAIGSFLVELEKDNLKMTKIKECCEKAVITVKVPTVKKERPATASSKKIANGDSKSGPSAAKASKRPTSKKTNHFTIKLYVFLKSILFVIIKISYH